MFDFFAFYSITYFTPLALLSILVYSMFKMPYSNYKVALVGYLTTSLLFSFLGEFLGQVVGNNLVLIPIFGLFELGWLSYIYYNLTQKKQVFLGLIPVLICLIYELYTVDFNQLNSLVSYTRSLSSFVLVTLALTYSYTLLKSKWQHYNTSFFLFNAALLLYAVFSCLYYLPLQLLLTGTSDTILIFWLVNSLITLVFYFLMTKALCSIPHKMNILS